MRNVSKIILIGRKICGLSPQNSLTISKRQVNPTLTVYTNNQDTSVSHVHCQIFGDQIGHVFHRMVFHCIYI